ncbi:hypothetical protein HU200_011384 [Digitaria exilis]|uniref:Uncharacterized protein n=1 Tax=Digitaria exilis TaxID=1010633 RepID=A0A835KLD4_9POAL|nr:hypothetical protein HU200_011384 [Digitaria exilis]
MAHQETEFHWANELLQATVIFAGGVAIAAIAVVGSLKTRSVVVLMGGLPSVILFTISFRLGLAALRKRRSTSGPQSEAGKLKISDEDPDLRRSCHTKAKHKGFKDEEKVSEPALGKKKSSTLGDKKPVSQKKSKVDDDRVPKKKSKK